MMAAAGNDCLTNDGPEDESDFFYLAVAACYLDT
jgi:hypothetical protein